MRQSNESGGSKKGYRLRDTLKGKAKRKTPVPIGEMHRKGPLDQLWEIQKRHALEDNQTRKKGIKRDTKKQLKKDKKSYKDYMAKQPERDRYYKKLEKDFKEAAKRKVKRESHPYYKKSRRMSVEQRSSNDWWGGKHNEDWQEGRNNPNWSKPV